MRRSSSLAACFVALCLPFISASAHAQVKGDPTGAWKVEANRQPTEADANQTLPWLTSYKTFAINHAAIKAQLAAAPKEGSVEAIVSPREISLPMPNGLFQRFRIVDTPLMSPELAKQWSMIKTYAGQGIDDPTATIRLDYGPNGFHGMVLSASGTSIIDPIALSNKDKYISYFRRDSLRPVDFKCFTSGFSAPLDASPISGGQMFNALAVSNMKTYRLAMNATTEYTTLFGGVTPATAAVVTSVNRVVGIYEREVSIRMTLVFNKCWTGADPFTNGDGETMLSQNQNNLDTPAVLGSANYDIGHAFSTADGGIAGLRVVGVSGQKAQGVTGNPSPIGDGFDIDYVAHEMGHQFGGNHTFNGTTGSCGNFNRESSAAYEPGSGSTIMAYAGICGGEDLQAHSDAYFHTKSFDEITSWRNNAGSGGTTTASSNNIPTVSAGAAFTIPQSTPFRLTATGADVDGDALTYCWEQFNLGTASPTSNNATRPLFRSFNPATSPTRFFPNLPAVLANSSTPWEILPNVNRSMTFRVTARDNRTGGAGVISSSAVITVSGTAFQVTAPNTAVTWNAGTAQTVTWTVGGGSVAANVNILLSTNGGTSYGTGTTTMLLANTPNDGTQTITVPAVSTTQARIIVEPVGNVFYDISNVNFTIANVNPTITSISPNPVTAGGPQFTLTVNGTNYTNGTSTVQWNGAALATTFVNGSQLTAVVPAANIATAGTASITVNKTGVGTSSPTTLNINNPSPTIGSLNPTAVLAGSGAANLTVNGSGFINGSVVRWNGVALTTTFVNSGQLTAAVPAANVATAGTASITVFNGTPGGGTSSGQTFTVNNPVPVLNTIAPNSAVAGSGGFTLTVDGASFVNGSVVNWNGAPLATTFVGTGQLTAVVPAANVASVGTASITVVSAGPGGGPSLAQSFNITPVIVQPDGFSATNGRIDLGGLAELLNSDDSFIKVTPENAVRTIPPLALDVTGTAATTTASRIDVKVERSGTSSVLNFTYYAWNFTLNDWVALGASVSGSGESVETFSITSNASQFLDASGHVKTRITCAAPKTLSIRWFILFDQVQWSIHP